MRLQAFASIATERENRRHPVGKLVAVSSQSAVKQLGECGIVDFGIMAPVNRYAMHGHYAVDFEARHTFCGLDAIVSEFTAGGFEYEYAITVFFYQRGAAYATHRAHCILNLERIHGDSWLRQATAMIAAEPGIAVSY